MGIGIVTLAVVLIVGYVIISRIVGLAFRFLIPLVVVLILGSAGVFSGLMSDGAPESYGVDQDEAYGQASRRPGADSGNLGDLRLRDIADMAVGGIRTVLQSGLSVLDRIAEPGPAGEPRRTYGSGHARPGEPKEAQRDFLDDTPQRGRQRSW